MSAPIDRLRSLDGVKWSRYRDDVLPAWVADMDFDIAPPIKAAIAAMVDRGDLGYNSVPGDALVPAWVDWQDRHHGWRPEPDLCRPFTGALHALETVMMLHTEPDDGVVIFTPIYPPFRAAIEHSRRRVVDVPLDGPDWRLDAERFESLVDPDTRLVLFSQPHNPLGRVFDSAEIEAFADVVERHDLVVVSDEIWGDLTHDGCRHLPLVSVDERLGPRTVTLGAATKSFSVAGLRCAVAHVGPGHLRDTMDGFPTHLLGAPSTLSAAATVAAWREGDEWLAGVKAQLTANLDLVLERVGSDMPGVRLHRPQATYLAWLDFTETPIAADPGAALLESSRVALDPGHRFGPQAQEFARLNFATHPSILEEILDRIAAAVAGGRPGRDPANHRRIS